MLLKGARSALFPGTQFIFRERNAIFFAIINCDSSIYTMDYPDYILCSFVKNPLVLKGSIQYTSRDMRFPTILYMYLRPAKAQTT